MRKFLTSAATTLAFCASVISASAQDSNSTFVANPYVAGSPNLFAAAVEQINNDNFFSGRTASGDSIRQQGLYNGPSSDYALNAGRDGSFTARALRVSDVGNGFNNRSGGYEFANGTTSLPTIVLTGFENSPNVARNSSGVVFPNTTGVAISNISFQYSPLSSLTGLVNSDFTQAPMLAITDEGGSRTRLLPVSAGLLATNAALNQYNAAFPAGGTTPAVLSEGYLTSSWTPSQLGIRGSVTQVGLVYGRSGIVMVQGFTINGGTVNTFVVDNISGYPF